MINRQVSVFPEVRGNARKRKMMQLCATYTAKYEKDKMIKNYHKIVSRDCYGCQKGGML